MSSSGTVLGLAPSTDADLPLPPLVLPPRQLKKIHLACTKWLARFLLSLSTTAATTAAPLSAACRNDKDAEKRDDDDGDIDMGELAARMCPAWRDATGCVVLNGGLLAGCTPHDVRATLLEHGVVRDPPSPSSHAAILDYSSTLPFVLCSLQLAINDAANSHATPSTVGDALMAPNALTKVRISTASLSRYAASMRASGGAGERLTRRDFSEPAEGGLRDGVVRGTGQCSTLPSSLSVSVAVLQLPSSATLWNGGSSSSANKGCGFLFLLPCKVEVARTLLRHVLQRPVQGIDALLREHFQQGTSGATTAPARVEEKAAMDSESQCRSGLDGERAGDGRGGGSPRTCVVRAVPAVPGLYLVDDFVSAAEEAAVWQELHANRQQLQLEYLSRRRVAHFNRRFLYGTNRLTEEGEEVNPRPAFYEWMQARLRNDDPTRAVRLVGALPFHLETYACDQLTVNYYDYGEMGACGISAHVDTHNAVDDAILVVSLGSYTVMDFARWDAPPAGEGAVVGVYLPPRSLAIVSGECRYGWTHCVAERRTDTVSELLPTLTRGDRLSLTWRRGRRGRHVKAECPFPTLCDGE